MDSVIEDSESENDETKKDQEVDPNLVRRHRFSAENEVLRDQGKIFRP